MDPFRKICGIVGIWALGEKLQKSSVLELLPCIGRSEKYALENPEATAEEIIAYLDSVVTDP